MHADEFRFRVRNLDLRVASRRQEGGGPVAVLDGGVLRVAPGAGVEGEELQPGGAQVGLVVSLAVGEQCTQEVERLVVFCDGGGGRRRRGRRRGRRGLRQRPAVGGCGRNGRPAWVSKII